MNISNKWLSFWFAFGYVFLATIYALMSRGNPEEGFLFCLFFPAMVFPSLILFTERDGGMMILICQIITLFPFWGLMYVFVRFFRKKNVSKTPPRI
jgi:hypothetical protein